MTRTVYVTNFSGIGLGVCWFVWGVKGFWWGLLYGAFWPVWFGYKLAEAVGVSR